MTYSITELSFILYNNRSLDMVSAFIGNPNPYEILEIERKLEWCQMTPIQKQIEVNISKLDSTADDIIVTPIQIAELTTIIRNNSGKFSEKEKKFLTDRGINDNIIDEYNILGLSSLTNEEHLKRIGATSHPVISPVVKDGIEGGGIIIPLFENNVLRNCAIRRISDIGKLKYTLAVPDVPVWGMEDFDEVWITEGIFDMMALHSKGVKCISVSSPMWSSIQLWKLLCKKPSKINILVDNDKVGYRVGKTLNRFFNLNGIISKTYHSPFGKDAAEHVFELGKGIEDFKELEITEDLINDQKDQSHNFLDHIQNRKF